MIYSCNLITDDRKKKQFYLTADNHNQLYRRILNTYGITKNNIEIVAEYKEVGDFGYELVKTYINPEHEDVSDKIKEKAKKIFAAQKRMCSPWKEDYMERHSMSAIDINSEEDLYPLLKQYKTIKVKWETGEKRGQHKYYALVK